MANPEGDFLSQNTFVFHGKPKLAIPGFVPFYRTNQGDAYLADSREILSALPDGSVNVVLTSPPYALHFKKEYGNE